MPTPPAKCRHWPFWIVIAALTGILGLSLLINLTAVGLLSGHRGPARHESRGEDEFPLFAETHSYGSGTAKVVRIWYTGVLAREIDGGWLESIDPVEDCLRQIRAARQDAEVAAILLEVDSPGGEVTAADEIHRELTLFKESDPNRKIVVLVHDLAASGGYYISVPADRIVAQPTALVGSIGVLLQTLNIQGLSEKIGVTDTTIKSGKNKDLLNPFRPVDPEQVALLQESIDTMHARFVDLVARGRGLKKSEVKPLADGRIYTAEEALERKLIDAIGYWDEAFAETCRLLGVDDLYVVTYQVEKTFLEHLLGVRPRLPALQSWFSRAALPRRLYLWRP
ncbi:MAG: signal peptide peptidase SppA [Akkermansiaceae bacterium]|jgi:protease-4|nr:signal peptide peptidase SppA [Akkermansiaceae bacterium]